MGWLGQGSGRPSRIVTPLSQPLPGVEPERPSPRPLQPPPTEVTVLSNGVRVISEASPVRLLRYLQSEPARQGSVAGCSSLLPVLYTGETLEHMTALQACCCVVTLW